MVDLVCSDVNGTIVASVYPKTIISKRTVKAIEDVCSQGITFVLASGRPLRTMLPVAEQINYTGMMICLNGALLYDYKKKMEIYSVSMPPDTIARLLAQSMRIFGAAVGFAIESGTRFICDQKYYSLRHKHINHDYTLNKDPAEMTKTVTKAEKVIIIHEHLSAPDLYAILQQHFADEKWKKEIHITLGHPHFIDISAAGVSKGVALQKLCSEMSIPADNVVAFGNMLNDLEMLSFAGRGVAVADSHPLLIASADQVTDTCSNDGVAIILEDLVKDRLNGTATKSMM